MQLKWIEFNYGTYFETNVFGNNYSVKALRPWSSVEEWIVKSDIMPLRDGFKTKEEAMVAAHQIIEKDLEKGYIGKACFPDRFTAKLSYIPKNMFGCKKALALFTNENGDEYIDSVLVSATIPKGSLVREVDPEHHDGLPPDLGICRKCRSDRAIITDILPPMFVRPGESINLPSRKTQRKKIPIISVHIVLKALRMYFTAQESVYGLTARAETYRYECAVMWRLIEGFLSTVIGPNNNFRAFCQWIRNLNKPQFPVSVDLMMFTKVLDPYIDIVYKYQEDPYILRKVLLAKILRDIGIVDIALRQSYKIGSKIQIDDFDLSNEACGAGFHFFKTAIEAWNYKFN